MSRPARVAFLILGLIALVLGGVWFGQGANLIPGSSMTGDRTWLVIGLVVAVVGLVLIVLSLRRHRRPRR